MKKEKLENIINIDIIRQKKALHKEPIPPVCVPYGIIHARKFAWGFLYE